MHEIIEETDQTDEPALAQIEQKYYPAYGNRMLSPNEVMIPIDDVDDFNREIIFMLVPKRQEQMEELVWPLSHLSGR